MKRNKALSDCHRVLDEVPPCELGEAGQSNIGTPRVMQPLVLMYDRFGLTCCKESGCKQVKASAKAHRYATATHRCPR